MQPPAPPDPFLEQLARVGLLWIVGALSAFAAIFAQEKHSKLGKMLSNAASGGFASVAMGSIIIYAYPGLRADIIMLAGIASVAGFVGFAALGDMFLSWLRARANIPQHDLAQNDDNEISLSVKSMMDSGQFTQAEIDMIRAEREKRRKRKELEKQLPPGV